MRFAKYFTCLVIVVLTLVGCGTKTERMELAEEAAPAPRAGGEGDFRERDQIVMADYIGNRNDVVFFAYQLAEDGRLIDQWICLGRPASSTESIEPNIAVPRGMTGDWLIKVDGREAYTQEVMGIDGTYGDAVPYFFCITPEGHYEQWSVLESVRISTQPRTYPEPVVRVDEAQFAKMEAAKLILEAGGCVDSNLNEIDCTIVEENLRMDLGQ